MSSLPATSPVRSTLAKPPRCHLLPDLPPLDLDNASSHTAQAPSLDDPSPFSSRHSFLAVNPSSNIKKNHASLSSRYAPSPNIYSPCRSASLLLVVYVDDIVITGDDVEGVSYLKYFLSIKVARLKKGNILSQRKYVLDMLLNVGMSECKDIDSPIDDKIKLVPDREELSTNTENTGDLYGR